MARPIRARMAPRNRNRQRNEQGKPTAGSSHSKSALAIRSPSRRLSGERLARLRARDALATAGKMPALLSLAQRFRIHVIEKTRRIPAAGFVQELLLCTD